MKQIVISKKTQKQEFFKANKHQDWFNNEVVREAWFESYLKYELEQLSKQFPKTIINMIDEDIDTIKGVKIILDLN